jgi:hypothetical protein
MDRQMNLKVRYITNKRGERTAVQVPIRTWKKLMDDYRKARQSAKLKSNLKEALTEIDAIKKGKRKPVLLKDFLNEL